MKVQNYQSRVRTIQQSKVKGLTIQVVLKNVLPKGGEVCDSVSGYVVPRHVLNHNGWLLGTYGTGSDWTIELEMVAGSPQRKPYPEHVVGE